MWTGLSSFLPYRTYFFLPGFLCAELFFLVGLFFLGCFDIQLNLKVNELITYGCEYFSSFFKIVLSEAVTVQQTISKQRYAYKGKYDAWLKSTSRAYCKTFFAVVGVINKK